MTRPLSSADLQTGRLDARLHSLAEYRGYLSEIVAARPGELLGIRVEFLQQSPFEPLEITIGNIDGEHDRYTADLKSDGSTGRASLWFGPATTAEHREQLARFVRASMAAFWRGGQRDEKGKILSGQFPALQKALEEAIREWSNERTVALLFADIDNFKAYNDQVGQQAGDRLIAKLSAALVRHMPDEALVVHRTGDEFVIVVPSNDDATTLLRVLQTRREVEREVRAGEPSLPAGKRLGLSVGVAFATKQTLSYSEFETLAERAMKPAGVKRRGMVSLASNDSENTAHYAHSRELSLLFALAQVRIPAPFRHLWWNTVSAAAMQSAAQASSLVDLAENVSRNLAMFETDAGLPGADLVAIDYAGCFQVALAVAHGLTHAMACRVAAVGGVVLLQWVPDRSVCVQVDGVSVIQFGSTEYEDAHECRLTFSGERVVGGPPFAFDSHRALLVAIGDESPRLPRELFAEVVYVDDRPTRGGGLPDFWEAALAHVISALSRFPNVNCILVTGNKDNGKQTLRRLDDAESWQHVEVADDLADKVGTTTATLRDASKQIAGRVFHVTDLEEAVRRILPFYTGLQDFVPSPPARDESEPPRLRRKLAMENLGMPPEAGCCVATAYEAFPVALELVRQAEVPIMADQAGRDLKELIDFQIRLSTPTLDSIPRFYSRERDALEEYFKSQFVATDGLFRRQLELNDQFQRVMQHVVDVVNGPGKISRRALLVVPHIPAPDRDLAPLGLVSVRVNPRPATGTGFILDFSFTWRTVEALVGLPYSLYGSIRFAELIRNTVAEQVISSRTRSLRVGELSYIAHSLHFFTDAYYQGLARRIVNEDTS